MCCEAAGNTTVIGPGSKPGKRRSRGAARARSLIVWLGPTRPRPEDHPPAASGRRVGPRPARGPLVATEGPGPGPGGSDRVTPDASSSPASESGGGTRRRYPQAPQRRQPPQGPRAWHSSLSSKLLSHGSSEPESAGTPTENYNFAQAVALQFLKTDSPSSARHTEAISVASAAGHDCQPRCQY